MMIEVTKIDDLTFEVRFDPKMTETLIVEAGWSSPDRALLSILSDALLGSPPPIDYDNQVDD